NDLQTPQAVALLFTMIKSDKSAEEKLSFLADADALLGLQLLKEEEEIDSIPSEVIDLAKQRNVAKEKKEYAKADELRKEIESKGYKVEDTKGEYTIKKI
ncbi:MAG: cysteine--tRNA ligase, partial [Candidatus Roizmanbacteria bacterium]|nr:cysteine--tRNA ligase [Candidatus Roizmanbacteria bacterium]